MKIDAEISFMQIFSWDSTIFLKWLIKIYLSREKKKRYPIIKRDIKLYYKQMIYISGCPAYF